MDVICSGISFRCLRRNRPHRAPRGVCAATIPTARTGWGETRQRAAGNESEIYRTCYKTPEEISILTLREGLIGN
ncbi:MAG: hypothetical protein MZU79_05525 [Anaerotruncus sp.]|nr:hypothetical protein [Anaerotruncus sp.]